MMSQIEKHLMTISAAFALAAFSFTMISSSSSQADSKAASLRVVQGTAKTYALALPPKGKASGGNAGLGFTSSSAMRAKGQLPSYVQAMLEPAELGDLSNDEGQAHLSSAAVSEIMNRHVNEIFQGCVLRELKKTRMSRVSIQMVISGKGEVTGATTKPGSKAFQGCVAKKLIAINFPKFAAPRMGAEYKFSFE